MKYKFQPSFTYSEKFHLDESNFQVTKSVISLLRYYHWTKFTVLYEEAWSTVAASLYDQAVNNNMSVQEQVQVTDSHRCCEDGLKCCQSGYWYTVVQNTQNNTRSMYLS